MKQLLDKQFIEEYLKKFKLVSGLDWSLVCCSRCPLCTNKLKVALTKDISYCKSKKHKPFIIRNDVLEKLST